MNGILLIHKEKGMTSHDVVAQLRRILHTKKIGHTGTLDPDATGVLMVLVGTACKALPYLEDKDKEYIAQLKLGIQTDTEDIFGTVIKEEAVQPIPDFKALLSKFKGKQIQVPPMISSVKVNGKKLYEYARAGIEVERPKREIEIYEIEALDEQNLKFRVSCSSGTYIRTLCTDLAKASGNIGCMQSLIRSKVGRFSLEQCVTLQQVEQGDYQPHDLYEIFDQEKMVEYTPIEDVYHGKHLRLSTKEDLVYIVHEQKVIAVYKRHHDNVFACQRGLW